MSAGKLSVYFVGPRACSKDGEDRRESFHHDTSAGDGPKAKSPCHHHHHHLQHLLHHHHHHDTSAGDSPPEKSPCHHHHHLSTIIMIHQPSSKKSPPAILALFTFLHAVINIKFQIAAFDVFAWKARHEIRKDLKLSCSEV